MPQNKVQPAQQTGWCKLVCRTPETLGAADSPAGPENACLYSVVPGDPALAVWPKKHLNARQSNLPEKEMFATSDFLLRLVRLIN